jgi:deazaflavin-dependent oxidoreductase (nitroreductase family)
MADDTHIRPPWWLLPLNKVFMAVMRLGLPISGKEAPLVLAVPGRKSGEPRSTPITPMYVDDERYVVSGFPGADWVKNARAADTATLTSGRTAETVRMVELPRGRPPPAAPVPDAGADGDQLHEALRAGHRRNARRVRGTRRALRGVPVRSRLARPTGAALP